MKIELWTFLTAGSEEYAEFFMATSESLKSVNNEIKYNCVFDETVSGGIVDCFDFAVMHEPTTKHQSERHASAMHEALNHINEDTDIIIFSDCDIALLYPDWDNVIVDKMNKGAYAFGGDYGGQGGRHPAFPSIFFFCFCRRMIDKIKKNNGFYPDIGDGDAAIRKDGVKRDTAWKLPKVFENKLYYSMPRVLVTESPQIPFIDYNNERKCRRDKWHQCEWHYNGKAFMTHRQASRNIRIDDDKRGNWKWRVEKYLESQGVKL